MTVSGAFAGGPPTMIISLPTVIDQQGDYQIDPAAVVQPVYGTPIIQITASNVNLDLNGQTIECLGSALEIGGYEGANPDIVVDHVSVKNGTFDGMMPANNSQGAYFGLEIGGCSSYVSVSEVSFTGNFGYNQDYGSYSTLANCTFMGNFFTYPYGYKDPGHNSYQNDTFSYGWQAYGPLALYSYNPAPSAPNDFKNITVLADNIQLRPNDTYQHFFYQLPTTILGGINVQPGNQNKNSGPK
jgi:hypothetical protein